MKTVKKMITGIIAVALMLADCNVCVRDGFL